MPPDNQQLYEQIKASLDIADIIGEHIKLFPSSRGFSGNCPFHKDDTPSFHVYTDTQSYYCFGCHKGGNIFNFVMDIEGINFHDAFQLLARRAGVKLISYEREKGAKSYSDILDLTAKFFTQNLQGIAGTAARAYMERRNMNKSDIDKFSLGYSLNSWDNLVNYLRAQKINDKQILDLGLALRGKQGLYDRFRGRLIFPIKNVAGNVVAFGGRLIDGEGAKYINSPESVVYSKRKNLYLLNTARKTIREKKRAILVEGYMDAIRLHKCGFTETIASLGTSLTSEQAKLLASFTNKCYICYDSDSAGQTATLRGMYILAENGLSVHVVNLPDGKDPDEFLTTNNNTPEMFEELLQEAKPLIIQHIYKLQAELNNPDTRPTAIKEIKESIAKLNPDEAREYTAQISAATGKPPHRINEIIDNPKNPGALLKKSKPDFFQTNNTRKQDNSNFEVAESVICSLLYHYSECRLSTTPEEIYEIMIHPLAKDTAYALLTEEPESLYRIWTKIGDEEQLSIIAAGDKFINVANDHKTPQEKLQANLNEIKAIRNGEQQKFFGKSLQCGQADSLALSMGSKWWPHKK